MSFWGIIGIVLLAGIILSIIFAIFHILFMLLPALIVIAVIIWLINRFTKNDDNNIASGSDFKADNWTRTWGGTESRPPRKKVRDAETKDVDK